jgi:hypothetical protein
MTTRQFVPYGQKLAYVYGKATVCTAASARHTAEVIYYDTSEGKFHAVYLDNSIEVYSDGTPSGLLAAAMSFDDIANSLGLVAGQ